jgi:hypothetical protein
MKVAGLDKEIETHVAPFRRIVMESPYLPLTPVAAERSLDAALVRLASDVAEVRADMEALLKPELRANMLKD